MPMDKSSAPKIETGKSTIKIPIPVGSKLSCKKGDKLKEDETLGQVVQKGEIKEYDLAKILKVAPKKVKKHLLCSLGSKVHQDQLIGEKKGFLSSLFFKSPISGTVDALTEKGVLKIMVAGEKIDIPTPVSGEIKEVSSQSVSIEFPALILKGEEGFGKKEWGVLKLVGDHKKKTDFGDLSREVKGKILVMVGKATQALFNKAEALGAVGIVVGKIDHGEDVDDLIVLVAGTKEGLISEKIWKELSQHQDVKTLISGEKKELVIPLSK